MQFRMRYPLSIFLDPPLLRKDGEQMLQAVLTSLSNQFDKQAKELIENVTIFINAIKIDT